MTYTMTVIVFHETGSCDATKVTTAEVTLHFIASIKTSICVRELIRKPDLRLQIAIEDSCAGRSGACNRVQPCVTYATGTSAQPTPT